MNTKLDEILTQALLEIDNATTFLKLNEIRAFYTGKKSPLAEIMKTLSNATIEDKKRIGAASNNVKQQIEKALCNKKIQLEETEINGSGPDIPQEKLDELFDKLNQLQENDILVLAGSIPSSLPNDIYEQIMKKLDQQGIKIIVDATNDLLKKVLPYHPFLIKPNHRELEELFNVRIENKEDLIHYARKLQKQGAINVLVSLGKDGAILVSEDGHVYYCAGAKGKLLNSVGSGDSMVAGFIAGYLKDKKYDEALKLGSACGGATAFSEDLAEASMIQEVYKQLQVEEL